MRHARKLRVAGNAVRLVLFALATLAAVRFFWEAVRGEGMSPRSFFGLLLLSGAVSLVWRATLDLRRSVHRLRS